MVKGGRVEGRKRGGRKRKRWGRKREAVMWVVGALWVEGEGEGRREGVQRRIGKCGGGGGRGEAEAER